MCQVYLSFTGKKQGEREEMERKGAKVIIEKRSYQKKRGTERKISFSLTESQKQKREEGIHAVVLAQTPLFNFYRYPFHFFISKEKNKKRVKAGWTNEETQRGFG